MLQNMQDYQLPTPPPLKMYNLFKSCVLCCYMPLLAFSAQPQPAISKSLDTQYIFNHTALTTINQL